MTDIDPRNAVDLSDVKTLATLREARESEIAKTKQDIEIIKWDRAMTRAFRGIVPRSTRLTFMRAAVRRGEVE